MLYSHWIYRSCPEVHTGHFFGTVDRLSGTTRVAGSLVVATLGGTWVKQIRWKVPYLWTLQKSYPVMGFFHHSHWKTVFLTEGLGMTKRIGILFGTYRELSCSWRMGKLDGSWVGSWKKMDSKKTPVWWPHNFDNNKWLSWAPVFMVLGGSAVWNVLTNPVIPFKKMLGWRESLSIMGLRTMPAPVNMATRT